MEFIAELRICAALNLLIAKKLINIILLSHLFSAHFIRDNFSVAFYKILNFCRVI